MEVSALAESIRVAALGRDRLIVEFPGTPGPGKHVRSSATVCGLAERIEKEDLS